MSDKNQSISIKMVHLLKKIFRQKGISLIEVAESIGVSERSIKRYLNGHSVTLDLLEKLTSIAGVSIHDLAELASSDASPEPAFTNSLQEDALADDPHMGITFYLLTKGWTPKRIRQEFGFSDIDMEKILLRMDRLGLIILYPENRVKLQVILRSPEECSKKLHNVVLNSARYQLSHVDPDNSYTIWRGTVVRLGSDSFERAKIIFRYFVDEIVAMSNKDVDLASDKAEWFSVSAILSPDSIIKVYKIMNKNISVSAMDL